MAALMSFKIHYQLDSEGMNGGSHVATIHAYSKLQANTLLNSFLKVYTGNFKILDIKTTLLKPQILDIEDILHVCKYCALFLL